MEESVIEVTADHIETCIMYASLIANPAIGKYQSSSVFDKAINEIEKYNETKVADSKLVKGKLLFNKLIMSQETTIN